MLTNVCCCLHKFMPGIRLMFLDDRTLGNHDKDLKALVLFALSHRPIDLHDQEISFSPVHYRLHMEQTLKPGISVWARSISVRWPQSRHFTCPTARCAWPSTKRRPGPQGLEVVSFEGNIQQGYPQKTHGTRTPIWRFGEWTKWTEPRVFMGSSSQLSAPIWLGWQSQYQSLQRQHKRQWGLSRGFTHGVFLDARYL